MPVYEYECGVCQLRFEKRQSFHEEPVVQCPECQGKAYRIIHSIPVIFKGSGFYTTDSRKKNPEVEGIKEKVPSTDKKKVKGT